MTFGHAVAPRSGPIPFGNLLPLTRCGHVTSPPQEPPETHLALCSHRALPRVVPRVLQRGPCRSVMAARFCRVICRKICRGVPWDLPFTVGLVATCRDGCRRPCRRNRSTVCHGKCRGLPRNAAALPRKSRIMSGAIIDLCI